MEVGKSEIVWKCLVTFKRFLGFAWPLTEFNFSNLMPLGQYKCILNVRFLIPIKKYQGRHGYMKNWIVKCKQTGG